MILIGDKLVPFEDIFLIENIKDIENTKANSTVLFDFNEEILTYCYKNELFCAVVVNSIKEAIYCNNLNVKYIAVSYNNTYKSKSHSSENKIKLNEIEAILRKKGETRILENSHRFFNAGKTEFNDHKEFL